MSEPKVSRGTKLRIEVEDPATPGTFKPMLLMTTKSFKRSKSVNDVTVPSRDNPDAVADVRRIAVTRSAEAAGSGTYPPEDRTLIEAVYASDTAVNLRIRLALSAADHGGYWQGAFHMTQHDVTADEKDMISGAVTFQSDGPVAWVDASS